MFRYVQIRIFKNITPSRHTSTMTVFCSKDGCVGKCQAEQSKSKGWDEDAKPAPSNHPDDRDVWSGFSRQIGSSMMILQAQSETNKHGIWLPAQTPTFWQPTIGACGQLDQAQTRNMFASAELNSSITFGHASAWPEDFMVKIWRFVSWLVAMMQLFIRWGSTLQEYRAFAANHHELQELSNDRHKTVHLQHRIDLRRSLAMAVEFRLSRPPFRKRSVVVACIVKLSNDSPSAVRSWRESCCWRWSAWIAAWVHKPGDFHKRITCPITDSMIL